MRKCILIILAVSIIISASPKPPYPIIFVHGLAGSSDETFEDTMRYLNNTLNGETSEYQWGEINSFDVALNFDNDLNTSNLEDDVKWYSYYYNDDWIRLGRRRFDYSSYDWNPNSYIFAINFKEERIEDASGINDLFDHSNQSAIIKQGFALGKMIQEVLIFTSASKVILVGHSMGGLCIREYLQRTEDGTTSSQHRWWVNPSDNENGHKVARVVTIGTPHLGSNSGFDYSNKSGISALCQQRCRLC